MTRLSIRGGSGLGDALYVQAVARMLVARGHRLQVHTSWPDVFRPLRESVTTAPFRRDGVNLCAHYSMRKAQATTQFEDCCIQAGLRPPFEMRLDWEPTDPALLDRLRRQAAGRPIVVVGMPRAPMARVDGFGAELLPDCAVIQRILDRIEPRCFVVQVGAGESVYPLRNLHVDLANETSVCQLLDVASIADGFLGFVSFIVPLAESLSKPALLVWSARGLRADRVFVRQITPRKVLFRTSSAHVLDSAPLDVIDNAADAFLR